jgi:hypothetical protein
MRLRRIAHPIIGNAITAAPGAGTAFNSKAWSYTCCVYVVHPGPTASPTEMFPFPEREVRHVQLRFTFEIDKNRPSDVQPLFDHHPSGRDRRKAPRIPGSRSAWAAACCRRVE